MIVRGTVVSSRRWAITLYLSRDKTGAGGSLSRTALCEQRARPSPRGMAGYAPQGRFLVGSCRSVNLLRRFRVDDKLYIGRDCLRGLGIRVIGF